MHDELFLYEKVIGVGIHPVWKQDVCCALVSKLKIDHAMCCVCWLVTYVFVPFPALKGLILWMGISLSFDGDCQCLLRYAWFQTPLSSTVPEQVRPPAQFSITCKLQLSSFVGTIKFMNGCFSIVNYHSLLYFASKVSLVVCSRSVIRPPMIPHCTVECRIGTWGCQYLIFPTSLLPPALIRSGCPVYWGR
jgi:hypothetical protein